MRESLSIFQFQTLSSCLFLPFHVVSWPHLLLPVFKSEKHIQKMKKYKGIFWLNPKKLVCVLTMRMKWKTIIFWDNKAKMDYMIQSCKIYFYFNNDLILLSKVCGLKKCSFSCDGEPRKHKPLFSMMGNLLTITVQSGDTWDFFHKCSIKVS